MIDASTIRPLQVATADDLSYLMLDASQLPAVRACLDSYREEYWVDSNRITIGEQLRFTVMNFMRGEDPSRIQVMLDGLECPPPPMQFASCRSARSPS